MADIRAGRTHPAKPAIEAIARELGLTSPIETYTNERIAEFGAEDEAIGRLLDRSSSD